MAQSGFQNASALLTYVTELFIRQERLRRFVRGSGGLSASPVPTLKRNTITLFAFRSATARLRAGSMKSTLLENLEPSVKTRIIFSLLVGFRVANAASNPRVRFDNPLALLVTSEMLKIDRSSALLSAAIAT